MLLILSLEGRKKHLFHHHDLTEKLDCQGIGWPWLGVEREECGCLAHTWRHLQVHILLRARDACMILLYGCHSLGHMTVAYFRYRPFTP